MSFNRLARSGLSAMRAARPSMPIARVPKRTYADAAETLKLSLTLPHQVREPTAIIIPFKHNY
jgi:hypothetical protein